MVRSERTTSRANPLLKQVRRAVARGELTRQGYCVAEGFHLLEECLRSNCAIQAVLVAEPARSAVETRIRGLSRLRLVVSPEKVFRTVAGTESSQGVLTLVRPPVWAPEQLFGGRPLVVVLDGVQDPGNAGAILRVAEAFGASGVMALKGTVNLYNPKAVRASAGSVFRVPLATGLDPATALAILERQRVELYAAMPSGRRELGEADLKGPCALIIGNEGCGVHQQMRAAAVELRIPTFGVESLNAAMAAAILLYEARRQRALP